MRFLIDECLPPFLGAVLRSAGHDAVAVAALDLCGVPDSIVMATAREQRRVLVSADTDFGEILARSNDRQPSVVLYRGSEVIDAKVLGVILLTNLPQIEESLVEGSIVALNKAIESFVAHWNSDCGPIAWTATAEEILDKVRTITSRMEALLRATEIDDVARYAA